MTCLIVAQDNKKSNALQIDYPTLTIFQIILFVLTTDICIFACLHPFGV